MGSYTGQEYTRGSVVPATDEEIAAQLTTTIAHLKAVLTRSDDDGDGLCSHCGEPVTKRRIGYDGVGNREYHSFCTWDMCPRFQARQHLKALETTP